MELTINNEEAVARLSMIAYFDLLFQILQSSQNNLRPGGDTGDPRAGGVVDGVQDGGVRGIQRSLAAAGSAVGAFGTVGLDVVQLDVIGNILGVRNAAALQAGVLGQVVEVLAEGIQAMPKQAVIDAWGRTIADQLN